MRGHCSARKRHVRINRRVRHVRIDHLSSKRPIKREYSCSRCSRRSGITSKPCTNCSTRWLKGGDRVFEMCEKNSSRQASVRERYFHLGARDRKVVREPESGGRALLPCLMAHATRHARAVSRARAIAARTPKSFPALAGLGCRCGACLGGVLRGFAHRQRECALAHISIYGRIWPYMALSKKLRFVEISAQPAAR